MAQNELKSCTSFSSETVINQKMHRFLGRKKDVQYDKLQIVSNVHLESSISLVFSLSSRRSSANKKV